MPQSSKLDQSESSLTSGILSSPLPMLPQIWRTDSQFFATRRSSFRELPLVVEDELDSEEADEADEAVSSFLGLFACLEGAVDLLAIYSIPLKC